MISDDNFIFLLKSADPLLQQFKGYQQKFHLYRFICQGEKAKEPQGIGSTPSLDWVRVDRFLMDENSENSVYPQAPIVR